MRQDMGIYWAWRGKPPKEATPTTPCPSKRILKYANIKIGDDVCYSLAITQIDVWLDGTTTVKEIHREELDRLKSCGCVVEEVE